MKKIKMYEYIDEINTNDIKYVGFWSRVLAHIIDLLLSLLIIPTLISIYFHLKDGQTLGYKIIGARIYGFSNNRVIKPNFFQLFLYPFVKMFLFILFIIPYLLGVIIIGFTKRKQGFHNFITKTVVVNVSNYIVDNEEILEEKIYVNKFSSRCIEREKFDKLLKEGKITKKEFDTYMLEVEKIRDYSKPQS